MRKILIALGASLVAASPSGAQAQDGLAARQLEAERNLGDLNASAAELKGELEKLREEVRNLQQSLTPVTFYQCPYNTHSPGVTSFLVVGCMAQISADSTCTNTWWVGRVSHRASFDCAPVTFYRKP